MKNRHKLMLAAAMAAVLVLPGINGPAGAEESATIPTDPGFNANTGQINPGVEQQAPSQSSEVTNIPTHEETRRAMMTPISKQPSTGDISSTPRPEVQTSGGPGTKQESQNAAGGPPGTTTAGSAPGSDTTKGVGTMTATTTGKGSSAAGEPPPSGPIGSFGETIPAKFSERNDILDRTPTMALPLPLTDQQRSQILDAILADTSPVAAGADSLKPASELSTDQALNGMHPLPESLRGIDGLAKLQYVKGKNKVLLVEPSTRIVVDEIKS
ncbi:MAG TPA: hypothetical protein VI077_04280 [Pseudolabrys sp.]|jgi:hypothetical protein